MSDTFCSECKFFGHDINSNVACWHPSNIVTKKCWHSPVTTFFTNQPCDLNVGNCIYFRYTWDHSIEVTKEEIEKARRG